MSVNVILDEQYDKTKKDKLKVYLFIILSQQVLFPRLTFDIYFNFKSQCTGFSFKINFDFII